MQVIHDKLPESARATPEPSRPPIPCFYDKNKFSPRHSLTIIYISANFFFDLFADSKKALTFATHLKQKEEEKYEFTYIYQPGSPAHYSRRGGGIKSVRKVCVCIRKMKDIYGSLSHSSGKGFSVYKKGGIKI